MITTREDIGIFLWLAGIIFGIFENQYFGWNMTPQSISEVVCDVLSVLATITGFILFNSKPSGHA